MRCTPRMRIHPWTLMNALRFHGKLHGDHMPGFQWSKALNRECTIIDTGSEYYRFSSELADPSIKSDLRCLLPLSSSPYRIRHIIAFDWKQYTYRRFLASRFE